VFDIHLSTPGKAWPRRWSPGTVRELWYQPLGAQEGNAVPYAVVLDPSTDTETVVLAHRDTHLYVRALELQPAGDCGNAEGLQRFTTRGVPHQSGVTEMEESIDQQTLRVRRRVASKCEGMNIE
jgi:hypothetical protein